ncbi:tetratricopeptide repeat protein [Aurantiacibacter sp. MUD11]|uniref:tetratricopeptide repeat protein n=1 Tax=Aurantiacibacter sp. MUD11 TaxID=3003265 RepID=UPI0022AA58AB|nr:tetratricopeptide repeat protein [Aurantiacibacter sp. MUD11]WAT17849.1 tetratricopeptide repeat protein [Aurantiacibacter sp. MUD11]
MARQPTPSNSPDKPAPAQKLDAEQEMLMREVDEAVRQDEVGDFAKKYGWPLGIAFALGIAAFGGILFWQDRSEGELEAQSEQLIQAIDELEAGNREIADGELAMLAEGEGGVATMAAMLRAGIAIEDERPADAVAIYDRISGNADLPAELRDIATIRGVSVQYDEMQPQDVVARVGPIAVPDSPYYGSAAELVANAYIDQGQEDQAGALLVELAGNDDVPASIRDRARRLAGMLGFDAIEDVDATLAEITGEEAPAVQLVN